MIQMRTNGFRKSDVRHVDEEYIRLFTTHQRRLFLYILAFLPRPAEAEEVLQETNIDIWRKCEEFESGSNFFAWASRIAYFEVLKFRTRKQKEPLQLSNDVVEILAVTASDRSEILESRRQALSKCLQKLRPRDRDLLTRRYEGGISGQTLAAEMNRPVASIYQSLGRIRRILLNCILGYEAREQHQ